MLPSMQNKQDAEQSSAVLSRHLDQEEAALTALCHSVHEVRTALLRHHAEGLMECLARQAEAFATCESARDSRHRLGLLVASGAKTKSLSALIRLVELPARRPLWTQFERLQRVAGEVERVNRANQLFVRHALALMERVLVDITGGEPAGQGYSRAGTAGACTYGRLIEARG